MADTEDGTRLQHPASSLHPADPADDLTGNTEDDQGGFPVEDGPDGALELTDDAAGLTDGDGESGDDALGDGTAGERPPFGEVDAMTTAEHGREAEAARANLSDDAPTPRETHTG